MCVFSIAALLATVMLLPVDVALVSSTTSSALGQRKEWATQEEVDKITYSLTVVYYSLYFLDALLCLVGIPFAYFWHEEYDEVAVETGDQTACKQFWAATKYTLAFIAVVIALVLVGFFAPMLESQPGHDLGYWRGLLIENRGEHAFTFLLGFVTTIGSCLYVFYTPSGLALLPALLLRKPYSFANQTLVGSTAMQLDFNRERQRQLEGRCGGNSALLSPKDRRELDTLVREERTLIRRQRLIEGRQEEDQSWPVTVYSKLKTILRPFRLLGGFCLFLVGLSTWISLLMTVIDKLINSPCKHHCGYVLSRTNFNPISWLLIQSSRAFPTDYIIFALIVFLFFWGSVVGVVAVGIRFLWIRIFQIRKGHTSPQAMLLATAMLTLITLGLNYSVVVMLASQYATFGPQTFCDLAPRSSEEQPDCSNQRHLVKPCSEKADSSAADKTCTPSVASTILNRVALNFPLFGALLFWAHFLFLGIYLVILVASLVRSPRLDERQLDEDAEEAEEETLLASTGRSGNPT
jgi:LMBR1 domain-containing protein 1